MKNRRRSSLSLRSQCVGVTWCVVTLRMSYGGCVWDRVPIMMGTLQVLIIYYHCFHLFHFQQELFQFNLYLCLYLYFYLCFQFLFYFHFIFIWITNFDLHRITHVRSAHITYFQAYEWWILYCRWWRLHPIMEC